MSSLNPINATSNGRGVTAVLGPTNTGKTHLAIERMTSYSSGIIGLPLRLLAREVYTRICEKVGVANVSLITGEEKITPKGAPYEVCTVEAMPQHTNKAFVAIDEVQLATDFDRGHVFTDRLMNLRGRDETMLLGAATIAQTLQKLLPGIDIITRPRMSMLTYAGSKKMTRMPARSAIVAFSANEVYAIAELIRRQRGGAAVVLGSLSPRTRNAQVELYQNGDVDFLVATDAIGMGLNLDLDHVAFAQDKKFDGFSHRRLRPVEMAQIAGRAGRHTKDGTFGVTGQVQPLEDELVEQLETHAFEPERVLTWRNRNLDFKSINALRDSLEVPSANRLLMKSRPGTDHVVLEDLARDLVVSDICTSQDQVKLLWDVCLTPDYRKISPTQHAELLGKIFIDIAEKGSVNEVWLEKQIKHCDNMSGEIDALSQRIAQIRTWTYLTNRPDWLKNATFWQEKTRNIEDKLSDALHENLTKRFIDRRTSVLMKRLRENIKMEAEIKPSGEVLVEGHSVGELHGFRFVPDASAEGPEAKAATAAAMKSLASEIELRAGRLTACPNSDIVFSKDGTLRWLGEPIAKMVSGDDLLRPRTILLADDQLTGPARDSVAGRIDRWVSNHIANVLKPLVEMSADQTLEGISRGVAFRIVESLGNIDRREIAKDIQSLDQDMRAGLRRHGVRFGAYTIFVPSLLKPAPAELLCLLWALKNDKQDAIGLDEVPTILASGRTSTALDESFELEAYRLCGYRVLGKKAVRIDILERLAELIRSAIYWKPASDTVKPEGAINGGAFYVTPAMMSILGATHEDMEFILKGLGYKGEAKPEAEIKPVEDAKEEVAIETSTQETKVEAVATDSADTQDKAEPANQAEEVSQVKTELNSEAIAQAVSTQTVSTQAEAEQEPEEVKTILVWRQSRPAGQRNKNFKGKDKKPFKNNAAKGTSNNNKNGTNKKPFNKPKKRPEKPLDPDSPFAKLAALKASMGK